MTDSNEISRNDDRHAKRLKAAVIATTSMIGTIGLATIVGLYFITKSDYTNPKEECKNASETIIKREVPKDSSESEKNLNYRPK